MKSNMESKSKATEKKKKIIIGVSGSIAAYKTCELVRLLVKEKLPVQVILTKSAARFITPLTLHQLSGCPCYIDDWHEGMLHIDLKNVAGVYAIVPATANILAKMANGIADDLVSSTYLTMQCPVIAAPAMNPNMFDHATTQRNLLLLKKDGVKIIEPSKDAVLCGDYGMGKLAAISDIKQAIVETYLQFTK